MTMPTTLSSDRPAVLGPLLVLEGMPGAGKTTAATALAAEGRTVIGEYTTPAGTTLPVSSHPAVTDDQAHQANWVTKHRQAVNARRAGGAVYCDRDWISALAYAASIDDGGQLLRARATWASERLLCGDLAVAGTYIVFDLHPATSLRRRANRLTPGHPWSTWPGLQRLAVFYSDPCRTIATVDEGLAHALGAATWRQLGAGGREQTLRYLRDLTDRP